MLQNTHCLDQWGNSDLFWEPEVVHARQTRRAPSTFIIPHTVWVVLGLFSVCGGNWRADIHTPACFCFQSHWLSMCWWALLVLGLKFHARTEQSLFEKEYEETLGFQAIWEVTVETRMPWQLWPGLPWKPASPWRLPHSGLYLRHPKRSTLHLWSRRVRECALCHPVPRVHRQWDADSHLASVYISRHTLHM